MRSKANYSAQSIMQPELFPNPVLKRSSPLPSKIFTIPKALELLEVRRKYCDDLLSRCRAFGHCSSISVVTALCCLYLEIPTYSKEQFEIDLQPYL